MKKFALLILSLVTLTATSVWADNYHRHGPRDQRHWHNPPPPNYHRHDRYNWVAPVIIGGLVTYALTRPEPVIIEQAPVIVEYVPPPYGYICTEWREIRTYNGNVYRERTCTLR